MLAVAISPSSAEARSNKIAGVLVAPTGYEVVRGFTIAYDGVVAGTGLSEAGDSAGVANVHLVYSRPPCFMRGCGGPWTGSLSIDVSGSRLDTSLLGPFSAESVTPFVGTIPFHTGVKMTVTGGTGVWSGAQGTGTLLLTATYSYTFDTAGVPALTYSAIGLMNLKFR